MLETLLSNADLSTGNVLSNLLYILGGFACHVLKKYFQDRIDPIRYLKEHSGRTGVALGAGGVAYLTLLLSQPDAGPEAYIAIGYLIDSVFNRGPDADDVVEKERLLEDRERTLKEAEEDYKKLKSMLDSEKKTEVKEE